MAKIVRYNGNLVPFASGALGTERTLFGSVTQANDITSQYTASFLRGWGIVGPSDQPTLQDFNAVSYTHGQILSYLHQMGVAEYNATQEYYIGSVTQSGGIIYTSLANANIGNPPSTSPASWKSASSGQRIGTQVFTSSGTYTPSAGMKFIRVRMVGGGGGSGIIPATVASQYSASGGGASGSYGEATLTAAQIGASQAVSIGAGGAAGAAGNPGGAGGATSVGALLSCPGGGGSPIGTIIAASSGQQYAPGDPGAAPTGTYTFSTTGQQGLPGVSILGATRAGAGGSSPMGSGGYASGLVAAGAAQPGSGYGSGASGPTNAPSSAAKNGAAGAGGIVIIEEFS